MIISNQKAIQDFRQVQLLSHTAPVYITEQGEPSYVLMRYEDFQKINRSNSSWESLAMTEEELETIGEFDVERDNSIHSREVNL